MREVGIFDARNALSALVELAEKGEEITITRHGKPVAKLVPPGRDEAQKARAREAVQAIREMREHVKPDPDGLTARDYVEMGRRY